MVIKCRMRFRRASALGECYGRTVVMGFNPRTLTLFFQLESVCAIKRRKGTANNICTRAVWKVRGLTLLLRVGTLWKCGDGLFFEVPPLASDALFTTLHPLLENLLQTVNRFEISCLGAPFSWIISVGFWRWCVGIERIVLLDFWIKSKSTIRSIPFRGWKSP
jgi:hypothetical protein